MTGAHKTLTPKSQADKKWAGHGHKGASGYNKTNKMTRPKDYLDKLLVKDVEQLAWIGSCFGEDRVPNLSEVARRQVQRELHSGMVGLVTWVSWSQLLGQLQH